MIGINIYGWPTQSSVLISTILLYLQDERFSMVLMLPDREDGLKHLIKNLQHHPIPAMLAFMRKANVQLTIPRATVEYSVPLSKTLQEVIGLLSITLHLLLV